MKRLLVIAVTAAALIGCATEADIRAAHGRACVEKGHTQGTAPYNQCVKLKHKEWRAAMQREHHRAQQRMMHNMRR
ncbi:MAG: hypothetical protein OEU46_05375 [Alphaproteobacteria bacterium]|nr:hypothetical protein [Alphaproteobacteria bacterium]